MLNRQLLRTFSGGRGDGMNLTHSSQMQVVHTNQWPIPYYKRLTALPTTLYPETDYNVKIMNTEVSTPDDINVFMAERTLKQFVWGREVLDTIHRLPIKGSLNTQIASPARSAEVYMEDLLGHVRYTKHQNARILKKHKLSDIFS